MKYFSYQNYFKISPNKSLRCNKITYGVVIDFVVIVIIDVVVSVELTFLFKQTLSIIPRIVISKRARTLNATIRIHFLRPAGIFLKELDLFYFIKKKNVLCSIHCYP
jgi:hypothetical protein